MNNTKTLYAIIAGLVLIIVIGLCFACFRRDDYRNERMMHRMPDGSMMDNDGMGMRGMMDGMMAGLSGKTGDAFDKEFLAEMIIHHQGAVEMAQAVLKTSKRPELIKLANDIITAQTGEIKMMQDWQKTWFK